MADEFSESEVVFSDHHHHPQHEVEVELLVPPLKKDSLDKTVANSLPVKIPERMLRRRGSGEEEEEEAEEERVPPHEILERRMDGKMAFSVCTGNGRTLKGRDLSQVRNSILRLTGFIEA